MMLRDWIPRSSTGRHFDCLDGLRGLAIVMVVLYHSIYYNPQGSQTLQIMGWTAGAGWMGVPIFFVLSGFLISYPMFLKSRQGDGTFYPRGYAVKRFAKIIPPFYLSLIVFGLWKSQVEHQEGVAKAAWLWAAGIPNLVQENHDLNASYWSLIVEAQFYVMLPLLFAVFRSLPYRRLGLGIFFVLLVVPWVARYLAWRDGMGLAEIDFRMARFPCKLDFFAWGVLFAWLFSGNLLAGWPRQRVANLGFLGLGLLGAAVAAWAGLIHLIQVHEHPSLLVINAFQLSLGLAGFFMLFFVFDPDNWGARIFSAPWLRFTGIISYEWFLFHQPVVHWAHATVGATKGSVWLYFLVVFVPLMATYVFSAFLYRYFSFPIMQRLRGTRPEKIAEQHPSSAPLPKPAQRLPD